MSLLQGPMCEHGYSVNARGMHPNGFPCVAGGPAPVNPHNGIPSPCDNTSPSATSELRAAYAALREPPWLDVEGKMARLYEALDKHLEETPSANLGLATTRELLQELHVRGEINQLGEGANIPPNERMQVETGLLLASLPRDVLEYRTVDSE